MLCRTEDEAATVYHAVDDGRPFSPSRRDEEVDSDLENVMTDLPSRYKHWWKAHAAIYGLFSWAELPELDRGVDVWWFADSVI